MKNSSDLSSVTLAVLAGGEGQRMGMPKASLKIGDRFILEYILDLLDWPGPTLLVTAPGREQPPGAVRFDREAVDAVPKQGPLRGVFTALEYADTDRVIVATVDMPGIAIGPLVWMVDQLASRSELLGLMLHRSIENEDQIEPFPFGCRKKAAGVIGDRLTEGRRSVQSLENLPGFICEPAPVDWPVSFWTNLNFPGDYHSFMGI